jgi:hypothetical protein
MSGPYNTKNTFTLGKNNKGDNPKRPDYRGELIDENGVVWELSGWIKVNRARNTEFVSGKLRKKEVRQYDKHPDDEPAPQQQPKDPVNEFLA